MHAYVGLHTYARDLTFGLEGKFHVTWPILGTL
jgi:hypothetical protein